MKQIVLLPNEMFQNDKDINCYNLQVSRYDGIQYWDVDIFCAKYPRMGRLLVSNFEAGKLSFDLKRLISLSLV